MKIFYSATTNGFYLETLKETYQAKNSWPNDIIELTDAEKSTYWRHQAPEGKKLGSNTDGRPVWLDLPAPTSEEVALKAKREAKQTGELYLETGITVPFTNEVANGVMQIQTGFDSAEKLVTAGGMTQAEFNALSANLEISPTVKLKLTPATMLPFAAWFWTKRASFF